MGFVFHYEVKWRLVGDGMGVVIMCNLSVEDRFGPRCRVTAIEDSEIGLNFLVYLFSFAVCLWVVGGGEG